MVVTRDDKRIFDGQVYEYHGWAKTEERANEASDNLKKDNYLVKVIPAPGEGFYIYTLKAKHQKHK